MYLNLDNIVLYVYIKQKCTLCCYIIIHTLHLVSRHLKIQILPTHRRIYFSVKTNINYINCFKRTLKFAVTNQAATLSWYAFLHELSKWNAKWANLRENSLLSKTLRKLHFLYTQVLKWQENHCVRKLTMVTLTVQLKNWKREGSLYNSYLRLIGNRTKSWNGFHRVRYKSFGSLPCTYVTLHTQNIETLLVNITTDLFPFESNNLPASIT